MDGGVSPRFLCVRVFGCGIPVSIEQVSVR